MNKMMLLSVSLLLTMFIFGCGKKDHAQMDMDSNAVISDNVVSITDMSYNSSDLDSIPVVVENAITSVSDDVFNENATGIVSDKPTPKNIQMALKNAQIYSGKVDGNLGPKSKQAIEQFQSQNGLKADGKVGPKTWKALSVYLNKPGEVNNPSAGVQGN